MAKHILYFYEEEVDIHVNPKIRAVLAPVAYDAAFGYPGKMINLHLAFFKMHNVLRRCVDCRIQTQKSRLSTGDDQVLLIFFILLK